MTRDLLAKLDTLLDHLSSLLAGAADDDLRHAREPIANVLSAIADLRWELRGAAGNLR